jgi:hypothetical protein
MSFAADAPTVTDWMQGWGEVLSVFVSTGALLFTGLLLRHEVRLRREAVEDLEATQARSVWLDVEIRVISNEGREFIWVLHNDSSDEVTEVVAVAFVGSEFTTMNSLNSCPPGSMFEMGRARWRSKSPIPDWATEVQCAFTDGSGLTWIRAGRQRPRRIRGALFSPVSLTFPASHLGLWGLISELTYFGTARRFVHQRIQVMKSSMISRLRNRSLSNMKQTEIKIDVDTSIRKR